MKMSTRRIGAIFRKELREYRHNGAIVVAMAIFPVVIIINPLISILVVSSRASHVLSHENPLLYLLAIPALVPSTLASYSVVGERSQGTLEPVLTTPIRREEFLLGKAAAAFVPALVIAYAVYGVFIAVVELFAHAGIASAVVQGPQLLAQLVFTPLIAALAIWIGIAVSARTTDARTAQQLSTLCSLPIIAVTSLIAYKVIHVTLGLTIGLGVVMVLIDIRGWRLISSTFDRERLITNTK
jgi:ABC-2 type transport system permease protein